MKLASRSDRIGQPLASPSSLQEREAVKTAKRQLVGMPRIVVIAAMRTKLHERIVHLKWLFLKRHKTWVAGSGGFAHGPDMGRRDLLIASLAKTLTPEASRSTPTPVGWHGLRLCEGRGLQWLA